MSEESLDNSLDLRRVGNPHLPRLLIAFDLHAQDSGHLARRCDLLPALGPV
jgi:hypothetical protein